MRTASLLKARWLRVAVVVPALVLGSCTKPGTQAPPATKQNVGPLADMATSTKADLHWTRGTALQAGLGDALLLDPADVCSELDQYSCVNRVHQVALGGNDPFEQALYEPLTQPGATTTIAFDRTVMHACVVGVDADISRAAPVVFLGIDLKATQLDPNDATTKDNARFLVKNLYQRFHGRDALDDEVEQSLDLLQDDDGKGVSGRDFSVLACFAVASTSESLFY